ncbi:MAG: DivIVA domain-containing protein [Actinomycetota bacterium]|nr:DivIVA domain-containing protein [Actinomycetota bacterium]
MAIKPIDVRRKEFKHSVRGYNADQVDDFLDAVADEFEHTYSENLRMREEISSLRDRLEQFEKLEDSIQSALVHAEHAANDLRESAAREAEDLRSSASREAETVRNNANREAEYTLKEAQDRAQQMLADSSSKVERAQESYEALKKAKENFAADFRHLLRSYIDVMDNVDIVSAKDIEASLRERLDWEAITAAREAASERDNSPEGDEGTRNLGRADAEVDASKPQPEVEEPEVEPSSVAQGAHAEPVAGGNAASEEVEDREVSLGAEGDSRQDYQERHENNREESRASRASRFLRRRG